MSKRMILVAAAGVVFLWWLGSCGSRFSPPSDVTAEQIHLINMQLDNLQESIAAIQSPRGWALLLFGGSVLVPMVLAVLLLYRADRSAIHGDEILNQAVRHGLTGDMVHGALIEQGKAEERSRRTRLLPRVRRVFLLVRWRQAGKGQRSIRRHQEDEKEDA